MPEAEPVVGSRPGRIGAANPGPQALLGVQVVQVGRVGPAPRSRGMGSLLLVVPEEGPRHHRRVPGEGPRPVVREGEGPRVVPGEDRHRRRRVVLGEGRHRHRRVGLEEGYPVVVEGNLAGPVEDGRQVAPRGVGEFRVVLVGGGPPVGEGCAPYRRSSLDWLIGWDRRVRQIDQGFPSPEVFGKDPC